MTSLRDVNIKSQDSPSIDGFGRWRTSDPVTLFDSKLLWDDAPLFWDESLESGAGITSSHSTDEAAVTLTSTVSTAGTFTRQTFMRFNYQPGKSQLIFMTFVLNASGGGTGVERRVGYFDDDNGIFLEDNANTIGVTRRTNVSGSAVDNTVVQSSWNLDKMDGSGSSGVTLDFTKTQILVIDFEWLGVGRARIGFVVDGKIYYVHEFLNANVLSDVYMSTPNLPLRYQMITTGSSPASTMKCICGTVISEGGAEKTGILRHINSGNVTGLSSGNTYAIIGIRLKSANLDCNVIMERLTMGAQSTDQARWLLLLNPTVGGTFTYSNETNSCVQTATGASTNTITGGTAIDGGVFVGSAPVSSALMNALRIGASIAGTVDEMVLAVAPITATIAVHGTLTWRELS